MSFLKFLGVRVPQAPQTKEKEQTDTVREISRKLDRLDPKVATYHALFACILSRVAHVDLEISQKETKKMEEILQKLGHLTPDMAMLVIEIAKRQNQLLGGVENYLFTREFAKVADRSQRKHLLECLLAVAAADESISNRENAEIRKIADELQIERTAYIALRSKFRDSLAVLKKP